jgi:hypothetical protein
MLLTLFAAALVTTPSAETTTTGALHDGCVQSLQRSSTYRAGSAVMEVALCDALFTMEVVALDTEAAADSTGQAVDPSPYCPPEAVLRGGEPARVLMRAFVAYVDRNPGSRDRPYADVVPLALAGKWPCPR